MNRKFLLEHLKQKVPTNVFNRTTKGKTFVAFFKKHKSFPFWNSTEQKSFFV
jgi:hypothetical protein